MFPGGATSIDKATGVKGVIIMYHGYSACPDSTLQSATALINDGYIVLSPLTVGHGLKLRYGCDVPGACVRNRTNISELPTVKEQYINWVDQSLKMLTEQVALIPATNRAPDFFVGSFGISLGGSLASLSAVRPNTPVQKIVLANPFWSITAAPLDFRVLKCENDKNPGACLRTNKVTKVVAEDPVTVVGDIGPFGTMFAALAEVDIDVKALFEDLVESAVKAIMSSKYDNFMNIIWRGLRTVGSTPALLNRPLFDNVLEWSPNCAKENDPRGGICEFPIRNLFAVHMIGSFALSQVSAIPKTTEVNLMFSERDGPSTDSLSSEFISRLSANGNKVSKCNFLIACTLADYPAEEFNNYCGVPHSLLSHAENEIISPFNLYWENNMIANILGFFNGKSDSLVDLSTDKAVCSSVPSSFIGKQFAKLGPTYIKGCQKYFK
jgi:hypothetical protein